MATKIKGIYKSFKFISQIFVVKEREMEIGYPTDVKHVAHIGWDGPSATPPTWMNEFKTAPDFSTSIGSLSERREPNSISFSTQDLEEPSGSQTTPNIYDDIGSSAGVSKKHKRKKTKSTSSPNSSSASSRQSRTSRSSRAMYCEREPTPVAQL